MKVVGIGETVLDIIFKSDKPQEAVPGGSTFNAIVSLGRAGVPCTIVTQTGDDHVGDIVCNFLRTNGVDPSYVNITKGTKSHISLAFLDENNDAHYQFYKEHENASISSDCPDFAADDAVLFGSFFAVNPVIRREVEQMLLKASEAGSFLFYDINFRAAHKHQMPQVIDNIEKNMELSAVVRGSTDDFDCLYGSRNADEIYEKYIRNHCRHFICTNGAGSIEVRTPEVKLSFHVEPVKTVSTIGAGDNFNAGFLFALMSIVGRGVSGCGMNPDNFSTETWRTLVESGIRFSADVCQSFSNNISQALADSLKHLCKT